MKHHLPLVLFLAWNVGRLSAFAPTSLAAHLRPNVHPSSTLGSTQLYVSKQALIGSIVGHVVGGASGTPIVFSGTRDGSWYRKINLPSWTPPDRIFGPVWTLLYSLMGIAAARVKGQSSGGLFSSMAMKLWAGHYVLNLVWAPVFFGLKRLRLGLYINYALLASLAAVMKVYYGQDPLSCYLLLPYLGWVMFATVLNYSICQQNPTQNGYNNAMFQADLAQLQKDAAKYADS